MVGVLVRTAFAACLFAASLGAAERINHAGRILGPAPVVTTPVLFNTAQADAIVAAMQIMPRNSPWNEDISKRPVHADSAAIMARIRSDLVAINPNRNRLRVFAEMNYVLVPDGQPLVNQRFTTYPDDSDFNGGTTPIATWPIPTTMPVETWPSGRPAGETLEQWQRDSANAGGDRHAIVVQPGAGRLFESWQAKLTGNTPAWEASNGAIFPLASNTLRPVGWTSGDAAGLPMFPALIRFDECERGVIEHALRIVVNKSRKASIYPATHYASSLTDASYPAMGQRVRLKSSFAISAGWSKQSKAVAAALKKYGALVADNGGFFSVSACPDDRFPAGCFNDVQTIDIDQFEVVSTTGPAEGPRAANEPAVDAGADQTVMLASGAALSGTVTGTAIGSSITSVWSLYDAANAPGTATFADPAALATSVVFSSAGAYTLLIAVDDGVHATAYDAVIVTVVAGAGSNPAPTLSALSPTSVTAGGGNLTLTLTGANFLAASTITWSGQPALAPTTVTAATLTVLVPASYLTSAGTPTVSVVNPTPGGGTSTALTFTVAAPSPVTPSVASTGGGRSRCGLGFGTAGLVLALLAWRFRR